MSSSNEVATRDSSLRSRMTARGDAGKDLGRKNSTAPVRDPADALLRIAQKFDFATLYPYSRHRRIVVAYRLRLLGSVYSLLQVTPFVKNNIQLFFTALTKNMFGMCARHSLTSFLTFSVTRFTKKPHRGFFAHLPSSLGCGVW